MDSTPPLQNGHSYADAGNNTKRPRILMCTSSVTGHTIPMIKIAKQLIARGYSINFLAVDEFQQTIENIGATWRHLDTLDLSPLLEWYHDNWTPEDLAIFFTKTFVISPMQYQQQRLNSILEEMGRDVDGVASDIMVLTESLFVGAAPLYYGAPLPEQLTRRPKVVNFQATSYMVGSVDLPPFGLGLVPGTTPAERKSHQDLLESLLEGKFKDLKRLHESEIVRLGGVEFQSNPRALPYEVLSLANDLCLQMSPPSLDYKISDPHPKVIFVGTLPPEVPKSFSPPPFWEEVTSGARKVVVVTQGTVEQNYVNLILPTIRALQDLEDVVVVAILGKKGATLEGTIPSNARIVDYLPYDTVLPYASAFVFNGGFGGFMHGVVNGVPMVFAGATEEKPEVDNRGAYSGVGINLSTGRPTQTQIRDAVQRILTDDCFKKRVKEIRAENEALRVMDRIEEVIQTLTSR